MPEKSETVGVSLHNPRVVWFFITKNMQSNGQPHGANKLETQALKEILDKDVNEIRDAAAQLDPAELVQLHELEVEGAAREDVADMLDELINAAGGNETSELDELLAGNVGQVVARLKDLPADKLNSLRELEESGGNRAGVLKAIDAALAPPTSNASPKEQRGEAKAPKIPAHCEPDYSGPLTGDQAQQRLAHFKAHGIDPDTRKPFKK